jgi:hypothetical protein
MFFVSHHKVPTYLYLVFPCMFVHVELQPFPINYYQVTQLRLATFDFEWSTSKARVGLPPLKGAHLTIEKASTFDEA